MQFKNGTLAAVGGLVMAQINCNLEPTDPCFYIAISLGIKLTELQDTSVTMEYVFCNISCSNHYHTLKKAVQYFCK
jgi:hypothetical protein